MNILFFLTPKENVVYLKDTDTLAEAMETMKKYRYQSVPIICVADGHYIGTITEGDVLWWLRNHPREMIGELTKAQITDIERRRDNEPVRVDARMEDLLDIIVQQNFVPVLYDQKCFIGIVTRKDVIGYLRKKVDKASRMNSQKDGVDIRAAL